MVDDQHNDGTDHRHEHAVDVEAGHACRPELVEQEAADHRADDAETMSSSRPWPSLLTTLLAMKPAISPSTIQPMIDMRYPFCPAFPRRSLAEHGRRSG